jgi:transcriptional regulator with XRE-family HTH domain
MELDFYFKPHKTIEKMKDFDPIKIAKLIREAKRDKKLTLTQLMDLTGVNRATISRMQNGVFTKDGYNLEKVLRALDLDLQTMLHLEPQEEKPIPEKIKILLFDLIQEGMLKTCTVKPESNEVNIILYWK